MLHDFTLGDLLRENRRSWPQAVAAVDGERRLTYPELDERVNRLANALRGAGVGAGDRVLWLGQTSVRVLELLFASAKLGAIFCPANWRQSADELRYVIEDLTPTVVVWQEEEVGDTIRTARAAVGGAGGAATWIQHDGDGPDSYETFLAGGKADDPDVPVDPASPVLALYTAAFDGRPNAALLSHGALIGHDMALIAAAQVEPGFRYLISGPLFHVGTMMFLLVTVHVGGTNVFMARFDPAEACRLVEAEGIRSMFLVPPMMDGMVEANADGRYDLSSLRAMRGSPAWNEMVPPDESPWGRALGGYGQTEVGGMLTFSGFGIGGAGSHGRPSPLVQVRIVDADGTELAPGEVGEIVARGHHVMSGYLGRDELNAAKQRGGWHHTGDLGRREADGTISFIGPKLRMIKSGAENIYPAEVERCLAAHPAVAEAAVIGVPDDTWGQSVVAIVALAADAGLDAGDDTAAALIEHCRTTIASYKKPRRIEFVDSIPRRGFVPDYDALDAQHGGGAYPGS